MTATWLPQTPSFLVPYYLISFLMTCDKVRKELIFRIFELWESVTEFHMKKHKKHERKKLHKKKSLCSCLIKSHDLDTVVVYPKSMNKDRSLK